MSSSPRFQRPSNQARRIDSGVAGMVCSLRSRGGLVPLYSTPRLTRLSRQAPGGTREEPETRYSYSDMGGQAQINCRSPRALSIRPTLGHTFRALTNGSGNAACCRV